MNRPAARKGSQMLAWFLAGVGSLWLAAVLFPALMGEQAHFVTGFFLSVLLLSILRWATRYTTSTEQELWAWLTIAWALGLLGNVAWGIVQMLTGVEPGLFSWLTWLYVARYIAFFLGLWQFSRPWRWTRWAAVVVIATAATVLLWWALFRPALPMENATAIFVSGALYPVMDFILLFGVFCLWPKMTNVRGRRIAAILVMVVLCYGAANWINFGVRVTNWDATSFWANFLWGASDILTGIAALSAIWRAEK
ncbi:MAG: hypothetical protein JXA21_15600 [Anaerolineae bacterium]|nr:hypothetical protein [Anaerolineae bacterium]